MNIEFLKDKAILNYLLDTAWAMEPNVLERMTGIVFRHADGIKLATEEIDAILSARDDGESEIDRYRVDGDTAIIPIHGVIAKYAGQVNGISQPKGTSVEQITEDLNLAMADRSVARILLHIESPGGAVAGVADLAEQIAESNTMKPIIAYAADMAASGAYWLASQASAIYISRTANIGSIGVYTVVRDDSKAAEKYGVNYTIVRSGRFKGVGSTGTAVKDEDLDNIRQRIQAIHTVFADDVAAGRNIAADDLSLIADGRVYIGVQAVTAGLADGIQTFEALLNREFETRSAVDRGSEVGSSTVVNKGDLQGDPKMDKKETFTAADVDLAKKEAVAQNNQRVQAVTKILAGHPDLLEKAVGDPACDATAATALLVPKLTARITQLEADVKERDERLGVIAKSGNLPADQDNADQQKTEGKAADPNGKPGDDGKAETYQAAVDAHIAAGKSKAEAHRLTVNSHPKSHEAWKDGQATV